MIEVFVIYTATQFWMKCNTPLMMPALLLLKFFSLSYFLPMGYLPL